MRAESEGQQQPIGAGSDGAYTHDMVLHARVKNGRFVIDEPADLPEGSVVELVPIDEMMDDEERAALDASIAAGIAQAELGKTVDADEMLRRLRAKS
jgi:hypothetical protein